MTLPDEPLTTAAEQPAHRATTPSAGSPTLDELFRRSVARRSSELALIDAADKARVTGQKPQRLTYGEADRAISSLARQFVDAGVPAGSVIAVQLPNVVEFFLTALAATRAGLVVAVLPLLWRQSDLTVALTRIGARAIVGISRIDAVDHAQLVVNAAAEAFSIRNVFGFGDNLPEGMARLEVDTTSKSQLFDVALDARRAAIITFDVTADGLRTVPRSHVNLIAGGLAVFLECGIPQGGKILSTMVPASFAGLASSLAVWLLSGGALVLHHPFDLTTLQTQLRDESCAALIAPAPLVFRLSDASVFNALPDLQTVAALWRMPERVASSASWPHQDIALTDIYLFGEVGLFGARRAGGSPVAIIEGPQGRSNGGNSPARGGEVVLAAGKTLALRGPMVPVAAFRASAVANASVQGVADDAVDTGYSARSNRTTGSIEFSAPPSGITAVGGYRFRSHDLDEWASRLAQGTTFTALPDQLNGHRLAGRSDNSPRVRDALTELGLNLLIIEAFREPPTDASEPKR